MGITPMGGGAGRYEDDAEEHTGDESSDEEAPALGLRDASGPRQAGRHRQPPVAECADVQKLVRH